MQGCCRARQGGKLSICSPLVAKLMWLSTTAGAGAKADLEAFQKPMRFPARGASWCRSYSIFTYSFEFRAGSIWLLRMLGRRSLSWAVPAVIKSLCSKKSAVRVVSSTYTSSMHLRHPISQRSLCWCHVITKYQMWRSREGPPGSLGDIPRQCSVYNAGYVTPVPPIYK